MKSTIRLKPDQLTRLDNNEQVGLCVPLGEQPPKKYGSLHIMDTEILVYNVHFDKTSGTYGHLDAVIPLQYPICKVLGVRGTDHHVKVVDTSVKRVSEIILSEQFKLMSTDLELDKYEDYHIDQYGEDFEHWFNAKYAKPRPRREKGKIVRYECWCWDMKSWYTFMYDKKCYSTGGAKRWKRKPLEIHVNPFCEFPVIKLEAK